jgi:hypothetical protein
MVRRTDEDSPNWESILRQIGKDELADDPQIQKLTRLGITSNNQSLKQRIGKIP